MRWKRVAWAGCLAPLFGGCLSAYHPHQDPIAERIVVQSERDLTRAIHEKAREAWVVVRCEFPRKMFTAEFRDGFLDGYADYLDRGGDAQPPAVPPLRYTRNKKYFTPEGHQLIRDYFLGFKYGTDVAVATGQRQYLTVPVLIPEQSESTTPATPVVPMIPPIMGSDAPVPKPLPSPRPISKSPAPRRLPRGEQPRIAIVPEPEAEGSKFGWQVPPQVKLPSNPMLPTIPTIPAIPPLPGVSPSPDSPIQQMSGLKLPEPPNEVPSLDASLPTPPFAYDFPDMPPLPINHPDPVKK